jgi:hypothetical protein
VVYGHDNHPEGPLLYEGRTNLDTLAWRTGPLTVGVFDDDRPGGPIDFIVVRGLPAGRRMPPDSLLLTFRGSFRFECHAQVSSPFLIICLHAEFNDALKGGIAIRTSVKSGRALMTFSCAFEAAFRLRQIVVR